MADVVEECGGLFVYAAAGGTHEYECADGVFQACYSVGVAEKAGDAVLADALWAEEGGGVQQRDQDGLCD